MKNCLVADELVRLFHVNVDERRQFKGYGNGLALCHSDASFLNLIVKQPHMNVSLISQELRITKGAVTQLYKKLHEGGFVEPYQREGNKKEKYFRLTKKGKEAQQCYQQRHQQLHQQMCAYIRSLNPEETKVIFSFLSQLNEFVPLTKFPCQCGESSHIQGCFANDIYRRMEEPKNDANANQ